MPVRRISGGLHDFVDSGEHAPLGVQDHEKIATAYEKAKKRKMDELKQELKNALEKDKLKAKQQKSQGKIKSVESKANFLSYIKKLFKKA